MFLKGNSNSIYPFKVGRIKTGASVMSQPMLNTGRTGLLQWLSGKESSYNAGDVGLILGSARSSEGENGNPLHHSCLENLTDRGAQRAIVHEVAKSQTQYSLALLLLLKSILKTNKQYNFKISFIIKLLTYPNLCPSAEFTNRCKFLPLQLQCTIPSLITANGKLGPQLPITN